eukprot:XP_011612814.1 PREDICTED: synapse-associated protein 1 isoform X1 [Takifugu rubripes]
MRELRRGRAQTNPRMLRNWVAWLGTDKEREEENSSTVNDEQKQHVNKAPANVEEDARPPQLLLKAKGLSGYIYSFASSTSKKLSESVLETAQTLKNSVEEGKINGIFDKTILGDFQKEQERFLQEKKAKQTGAAVPPWVGFNEEETVQQQILALSADRRNFLRDPPAGVHFHFDCEQMYPVAMVMLEEDELLRKMRFHLVPKEVKEEVFWRNYFYRVSLIKQSAQLTALAAQQTAERQEMQKTGANLEAVHQKDTLHQKTVPSIHIKTKPYKEEVEVSFSPPGSEFVSDAFDSCKINEDDLRKEMQQLVLDKEHPNTQQEETPDWERELQEELQLYECQDHDNVDENWDREIEEMLKEES